MLWNRFERFVDDIMREEPIVGLGVAVAKHGRVLYSNGFGVADLETKAPVTPETIFGVASVTKSFTALAVMRLVEQGRLSLDAPLVDYLPEFRLAGVKDMSAIKLCHLLTHSTGLPPMRRRQDLTTFAEHIAHLAGEETELLGEPGIYVSYCNDTYLLLGAVIEAVTGTSFRRHIAEVILEPLDMRRSTLEDHLLHTFGNLSTPYVFDNDAKLYSAVPWPVLNNYAVGGGVRSCLNDLIKYGGAYIGTHRLVEPATRRAMYSQGLPVGQNAWYGFGLRYTPAHGGVTLVEHGGGQPGVSSHFGFVPEEGIVAAVLANVTNVGAARLWLGAINTALHLPLEYDTNALQPQDFTGSLSAYVGTYSSAEGGRVVIEAAAGKLTAQTEEITHELTYAGGNTFFFNYRGQRVLRFYLGPAGRAWAVLFGLRMLRRQ
jgi:CubicO group peptidase (beta-lactamase class C family)